MRLSINFGIHFFPGRGAHFLPLFANGFKVFPHKVVEIEASATPTQLVGFDMILSNKAHDHSGLELEVSVFPLTLRFAFYDTRHYDER